MDGFDPPSLLQHDWIWPAGDAAASSQATLQHEWIWIWILCHTWIWLAGLAAQLDLMHRPCGMIESGLPFELTEGLSPCSEAGLVGLVEV